MLEQINSQNFAASFIIDSAVAGSAGARSGVLPDGIPVRPRYRLRAAGRHDRHQAF